ncbi:MULTISPECIES: FHA domain-containing protein [unclassified Frankia]|uniref:FHA domain-containing protein n=1 Tax=unclassified Frankia TaxID=2632575 RepID=UPI002AD27F20|nr:MULTISPECIES: FHA domain-containing protein [unclassified Frankia]
MAGLDRFRVEVVTGRGAETGVVVRLPGVLVVARAGRPETHEVAKTLLAMCAEVAGDSGPASTTGRRLVRRVAGLLADADPDAVPDFTLLAGVGDRLAALIHGSMELAAYGPTPLALSGAESATWVDRLLPAEVGRLDIGPVGTVGPGGIVGAVSEPTREAFPLDLRIGAVPGIGASLVISDSPIPVVPRGAEEDFLAEIGGPRDPMTSAEPIPSSGAGAGAGSSPESMSPMSPMSSMSTAPPALAPLNSQDIAQGAHWPKSGQPTQAADFAALTAADGDPPTELAGRDSAAARMEDTESEALTELPGRGLDVADLFDDQDAPTMLPGQSEAQVEGILCTNDHFNHPDAPYCTECGLSLARQTGNPVWGPRPTIGVILLDDGTEVHVDTNLVIGRQPDRDEAVQAGRARPLMLEDGESAVSRVHAVITLSGWDAVIADQGSANGTYIAPPEATVWTPLNPHDPAPLVPGTRVQVGKRTFVFNPPMQG